MTDYERGQWDMFNLLSSAWYGKQCYFNQESENAPFPDGVVYSRLSAKYMTMDKAVIEFANKIGDDGKI